MLNNHTSKKNKFYRFFFCITQVYVDIKGRPGIFDMHSKKKSTFKHLDPNMPVMMLPDTIWSFQVLNRVPYLWQAEAPKTGAWKYFFS